MIIIVLAVDAFGAYGVYEMRTEYNVIWYVGPDSYNAAFLKEVEKQFPENGDRVQLYLFGEIEYWKKHDELLKVYDILNSDESVTKDSVRFWYPIFYSEQCEQGTHDCSTGNYNRVLSKILKVS